MEPELIQSPSPGIFAWFRLICLPRGDSTAGVVTLDTAVDESRKMVDSVTRFPVRLCSRDGKLCYYGRLQHDFLLCLASYFSYFLIPYPGMFVFFVFLRLSSSHLSATLQQVVRVLVSFVSCLISESLLFYLFSIFGSSYFWLACLLYSRTQYVST